MAQSDSPSGTQYNAKIERIMDALPMSFAVSLDGATKETVESIRVNANYEEQLQILKRFRQYTRERRTDLSLTFCFMRQNWHEFGDYCLFADEWGCNVRVNTVVKPPEFGVYNLPAGELRKIFNAMEVQALRLDSALKQNRAVWFAEFDPGTPPSVVNSRDLKIGTLKESCLEAPDMGTPRFILLAGQEPGLVASPCDVGS
jgi:hypothetical protein